MAIIEDIEPPSDKSGGNKFFNKTSLYFNKTITLARDLSQRAIFWLKNEYKIYRKFIDEYRITSSRMVKIRKNAPHIVILTLAVLVIISNVIVRTAKADLTLSIAEPSSEIALSSDIDQFTPIISGDGQAVESAYFASSEEFTALGVSVATNMTVRTEPLPDNSTNTVDYVVRPGDTLTGLGWEFGVKLSTLRYINKLSNVDMIKPGQNLSIPPEGYTVAASTITAWKKSLIAKKYTYTPSTKTKSLSNYNGYYSRDIGIPISYNGVSRGYTWYHRGIDYRANTGTPVYAATSGRVMTVGWNNGGYGKQIILNHNDSRSTRYAHLSGYAVSRNDYVKRGQLIGYSGNTGRSTGPHLHFELMVNGRTISPFK